MPIPDKLRSELSEDPFYSKCCITGKRNGKIDWHHCYTYGGRQVNEKWNILPIIWNKHNWCGDKDSVHNDINTRNKAKFIALSRADLDDLCKRYYKFNWKQEYERLKQQFGKKEV